MDELGIPHRVNAFQRYSSVILQRSTREGFGLTVTVAMWKYQPVVGTSATGLRAQIIDGQNGGWFYPGSARVTNVIYEARANLV
jgi:glycosyltransferase involved in cell wall biosynthesis